MRALYELLKRVPLGIKAMTETMSEYLRAKGRALVEDYIGVNEIQKTQSQSSNVPTSSKNVVVQPHVTTANPILFIQVKNFNEFFF